MFNRRLIATVAAVVGPLAAPLTAHTQEVDMEKGYAKVNGLEMYYEIHGSGRPLVLLHGAFSAIGVPRAPAGSGRDDARHDGGQPLAQRVRTHRA